MTKSFLHRHLLDTEILSAEEVMEILDLAEGYARQNRLGNKKIDKLKGRTSVNLFFEDSTRTRTSFEIAAKRLGADVINVPVAHSSQSKGETFADTVRNLDAMHIDTLVIRHPEDGAIDRIAEAVEAHVINAGDGKHAHPTQALLDAMTIRRHKGQLEGLTVAICGDLARSRVARSNVHLLKKFGVNVRVIAPEYFMSSDYMAYNVELCENLEFGLRDVDAIIMLRIQHERPGLAFDFSTQMDAYCAAYRLDHAKLKRAKPDVIILHPGPVNRGVELTDALTDDPKHSVIREQVELGVAVRMAVMDLLVGEEG